MALGGADVSSCMTSIGNVAALGTVAKFCVAFPFTYHYAGGIRHLMWDRNPEMLEKLADVESSSYIVAGSAAAVSVALALL